MELLVIAPAAAAAAAAAAAEGDNFEEDSFAGRFIRTSG
jgi:hypothetical protein